MEMSFTKPVFCFLPIAMLAACSTTEGQFPSLERRPYESKSPILSPAAEPYAPTILTAELQVQVDALLQRHMIAQAAFADRLPSVAALASRASDSSPGAESWVNAHLQLSRLDKIRADSVAVVRAFDTLIADQGRTDSALVPLLSAAQRPVAEDIAAQNDEIGRLSRLIGE